MGTRSRSLSITSNSTDDKVVFIENDWNFDISASATDHPAFNFGTTTLQEIRKRCGSNSITWQSVATIQTDDKLVTFNAYELKGQPNTVVVFVTSLIISKNRSIDKTKIAQSFKLESIILANATYLDTIWGKARTSDPNAKPIDW
jgi:hypothetical protein